MEAKTKPEYGFPPSGSARYIDDYGVIYEVSWETTLSGLDITTIVRQPHVWGEADQGFVRGTTLFRRGLVSVQRQIIASDGGDYVIRSEGGEQSIDVFQASFPCGPKLTDPFGYHLNNYVTEDAAFLVTCGPRWADPDEAADDSVTWGDISVTGGGLVDLTPQSFAWIDVWNNDEQVDSTCV